MKTQSIMHLLFRNSKTAAILAGLLFGPSTVPAADFTWNCQSFFWDDNTCWNPNGTPSTTSSVDVLTVGGSNTILRIDDFTGTADADSLLIDASAGTSVTLSQTGGALTVNNETMGLNGSGFSVFDQSGGTHTVNNSHIIGENSGSNGSYNLSAGTHAVSDTLVLGLSGGTGNYTLSGTGNLTILQAVIGAGAGGTGVFIQNGGSNTSTLLQVGQSGGTGSYTLNNGSLATVGEIVGFGGTGTFTQNGATHTVGNNLILGEQSTGNGTYNLNNGTLTVNGSIVNGAGQGIFSIDGGTLVVGGGNGSIDVDFLRLGSAAGTTGSHTLSGTGNLIAQEEYIGLSGNGTFTQNGGTHTVNSSLVLGFDNGSNGTYNLIANGLTTGSTTVGFAGTGTFNQSGGTHTVNDDLSLGLQSTGNGTYNLNNGTLTVSGNIVNGAGSGTLAINGGSLMVGGGNGSIDVDSFRLGSAAGTNVSHILSGNGSLATNFEAIGYSGTGSLTQSGGTHTANSLFLGTFINSNGSYDLSNGNLTANTENIGFSGTGTFTQSGGTHTVNGDLFLGQNSGSNGSYDLSAGSLTTNFEAIGVSSTGTFTQTGGTHTVTQDLTLGQVSGGNGTYNLNSGTLTVFRDIVNGAGTGILNIDGGTLIKGGISGSGSIDVDTLVLGSASGKNGSHTLSGTTSLTANTETIGAAGTGIFTQTGGTHTVSSSLYLGKNNGSFGGYEMDAGTLAVGGGLYVGGSETATGGLGVFSVNTGSSADITGPLRIWSGTVDLNGGTLNVGMLDPFGGAFNFTAGTLNLTNSDLLVDAGGILGSNISLSSFRSLGVSGTTMLNGASTLTLDGGTFSTGSLVNNGGFTLNSGTFNLTGDDLIVGAGGLFGGVLQVSLNQNINVSNTTTVDGSGLLYLNGGSFSSGNLINNGQVAINGLLSDLGGALGNNGLLNGDGRVSAVLTNNAGGEVQVGSGDTLRFTAAGNSNSGEINLSSGTARFDQDLTNASGGVIAGRGTLIAEAGLTNDGDLNLSGGTTDIFGNVNNTSTGGIIVTGGSTMTLFDDLVHNGTDKIRVSAGSQLVIFGTASGDGSYEGLGDLWFEGGVSPGNSPAQVSIAGGVTFGLDSSNVMEIAGLARGAEYDAFDVGNTLTLAGELDVVLLDLFAPQLGDSFDLFTAETIAGGFDLLSLAALGGGLGWQLDVLVDAIGGVTDVVRLSVVTSAVPVPAAVWLFCSGLLGLIGIARRRQSA